MELQARSGAHLLGQGNLVVDPHLVPHAAAGLDVVEPRVAPHGVAGKPGRVGPLLGQGVPRACSAGIGKVKFACAAWEERRVVDTRWRTPSARSCSGGHGSGVVAEAAGNVPAVPRQAQHPLGAGYVDAHLRDHVAGQPGDDALIHAGGPGWGDGPIHVVSHGDEVVGLGGQGGHIVPGLQRAGAREGAGGRAE